MSSKVILVTDPDDILVNGLRILLVDLTHDQENLLSNLLAEIDFQEDLIVYNWKYPNNISWCLDKRLKSDLIFFNAESDNQTLVGFLSAQKNSYYFGVLRDLFEVNKSAIQDRETLKQILTKLL